LVKISKGMKVTLKVDLSVAGGQQLEKNQVEFVYGSGAMLSGLEAVLAGLEKGAKREGTLKAKDAFGNPAMHPLAEKDIQYAVEVVAVRPPPPAPPPPPADAVLELEEDK
jgi:FKBP-type peptidyl-prolyl cis-trans isomerase 2